MGRANAAAYQAAYGIMLVNCIAAVIEYLE